MLCTCYYIIECHRLSYIIIVVIDISVLVCIFLCHWSLMFCREGFFTSVTKSLKRVSGSSSLNTSTEAESLENSMRKVLI